ncbi:MAG: hypothetical protein JW888_15490 [Pirellulales bacterium]|nr:hypothetical protein [Pirellulales bacterium]
MPRGAHRGSLPEKDNSRQVTGYKNRLLMRAAWVILAAWIGGASVGSSPVEAQETVWPAAGPPITLLGEPLLGEPAVIRATFNRPLVDQPLPGPPLPSEPLPEQSNTADANVDANVDFRADSCSSLAGLHEFWGYRYSTSVTEWVIGGADYFGMFSFGCDHYQPAGFHSNVGTGMEFHFLNGPRQTDMPPRVYDFSLAYQCRQQLGPLAYDLATSVKASSDFEGDCHEGIRFPSHAVGYLQLNPATQLVFGVDYLDRADIKLLPVGGLIWLPRPDMRFELVFPRPRVVFQLSPPGVPVNGEDGCFSRGQECRLYIAGDLGGGTWAVERAALYDDRATYRDLRLMVGIESVNSDGSCSALEIGYLFARHLEYTSANGDQSLDDTAMIRFVRFR